MWRGRNVAAIRWLTTATADQVAATIIYARRAATNAALNGLIEGKAMTHEQIAALVERLSDADRNSIQRINGSRIFNEAAEAIQSLAARNAELEAEVARLRAVMERCAKIVDRNLYHQHEKIVDVPLLLRAALEGKG